MLLNFRLAHQNGENMENKSDKTVFECRICGKKGDFKTYYPRDMMYEIGEEFEYFCCDNCGCLQISEVPEDMSIYYKSNYYSFLEDNIKDEADLPKLDSTRILDVGCGSGRALLGLRHKGYYNLMGCDPFIEKDIEYKCNVTVKKCTIHEVEGKFDVINMSDSFEHMSDPLEALKSTERLLTDDGYCTISVPVVPNITFNMYGENWYQIDAPRHLYLHSLKGLVILAKQAGLRVINQVHDSTGFQFAVSELYKKDLSFKEINDSGWSKYYTQSEIDKFEEMAAEANKMGVGDHAVFTLIKNK